MKIQDIAKELNIIHRMREMETNYVIDRKTKDKKIINFVQIGANDGVTNDPIYKYVRKGKWRGYFVEPVPSMKRQLKKTYPNIGKWKPFDVIQAVIGTNDGEINFLHMKDLNSRSSSVIMDEECEKDELRDHRENMKNREILKVKSYKPMTFFKKYDIKKLDFLQCDAEGMDINIIKLIDFDKIDITMMRFEHSHSTEQRKDMIEKYLQSFGYRTLRMRSDIFSYKD